MSGAVFARAPCAHLVPLAASRSSIATCRSCRSTPTGRRFHFTAPLITRPSASSHTTSISICPPARSFPSHLPHSPTRGKTVFVAQPGIGLLGHPFEHPSHVGVERGRDALTPESGRIAALQRRLVRSHKLVVEAKRRVREVVA